MKNEAVQRLAVGLIALLILAPGIFFYILRLTLPSDGARLVPSLRGISPEGVVVVPLILHPDQLHPDDLVVQAAGVSMEEWAQSLFSVGADRPEWELGGTITYSVVRAGSPHTVDVVLRPFPMMEAVKANWGSMVYAPVFLIVGAFVFLRRPDVPAAKTLLILSCCIVSATTWSIGLQVSDFIFPAGFWMYKITTVVCYLGFFVTGFHFALSFPKPLPHLAKYRWLVPTAYLGAVLLVTAWIIGTRFFAVNTLHWLDLWIPVEGITAGTYMFLTLAAFMIQYRANRSGSTRQQIRWVVWAVLFSGGAGLILYLIPVALGGISPNPNFISLLILPFPLSIAVSILKHNLFEIDRLINRTLLYGLLTASVGGIYLVVVGGLSRIFENLGSWYIVLFANALAAMLFQPLRIRLGRLVNRFMYGERDEPYDVLDRLSKRLDQAVSLQAALPTIVETVAQALKLPFVEISVSSNSGMKPAASYGKPSNHHAEFPISNQGEMIGQLLAGRRAPDEVFTGPEQRLLQSIAAQAGPVVHSILLTEDLRKSRQRILTAQEEERRRLRRDLHDGLGPTLASHLLKIGSARMQVQHDTAMAEQILTELEDETEEILSEIRRLVYNLRPPSIDQLGLGGAVQVFADQFNRIDTDARPIHVEVNIPEQIPTLPAAVEVAAYRIITEAVNNASRHAEAARCSIRMWVNQDLHLSIKDDGCGLPENHRAGVGLASMKERADELGGKLVITSSAGQGTEILVVIPLISDELERKDEPGWQTM